MRRPLAAAAPMRTGVHCAQRPERAPLADPPHDLCPAHRSQAGSVTLDPFIVHMCRPAQDFCFTWCEVHKSLEPEHRDKGAELSNKVLLATALMRSFRSAAHLVQVVVTFALALLPACA